MFVFCVLFVIHNSFLFLFFINNGNLLFFVVLEISWPNASMNAEGKPWTDGLHLHDRALNAVDNIHLVKDEVKHSKVVIVFDQLNPIVVVLEVLDNHDPLILAVEYLPLKLFTYFHRLL